MHVDIGWVEPLVGLDAVEDLGVEDNSGVPDIQILALHNNPLRHRALLESDDRRVAVVEVLV